jgi:hypothetical protein
LEARLDRLLRTHHNNETLNDDFHRRMTKL